ncbi:MAG: EAL domain-containing protein [Pseudomonadota bacterium]|nr:EAL domain-containing protein [Pseudomonadota bacterium]
MRLNQGGLGYKIALIVGVLFLFAVAFEFFLIRFVMLDHFAELEATETRGSVSRARSELMDAREQLGYLAEIWAAREAVTAFVRTRDNEWVAKRFDGRVMRDTRLSLIAITDSTGRILFARVFDLAQGTPKPVTKGLLASLRAFGEFYQHESVTREFLQIGQSPWMLASAPVLTDQRVGGYVLVGRELNAAGLKETIRDLSSPLAVVPIAETGASLSEMLTAVPVGTLPIWLQALDDATLSAVAPLDRPQRDTDLVLKTELPRNIYSQGRRTLYRLLVVGWTLTALMAIMWAYVLNRLVVSRIERLTDQVRRVGAGRQRQVPEQATRQDELGELAHSINSTVRQLNDIGKALRQSEAHFRTLAESINACVVLHREDILYCNPAVTEMLGYTVSEMVGQPTLRFVAPDDREREQERMARRFRKDSLERHHEVRLLTKSGEERWFELSCDLIQYEGRDTILNTAFDITHRKLAEERLQDERDRIEVTLASIGDGVIRTDLNGAVDYVNPVAETLTGWSFEDAKGRALSDVLTLLDEETRRPLSSPAQNGLVDSSEPERQGQLVLVSRGGGAEFSIEITKSAICDDSGDVSGMVLALHDVTQLRGLTKRMAYEATHDGLTGLVNRPEFEERLAQTVEAAEREFSHHALCYLDLDQFKVVNDTWGHVAGDELLRQLASKLKASIRQTDTIARLGGDEFGVLFRDCSLETAQRLAEKLRNEVKSFRFTWGESVLDSSVTIGLVPIDQDSANATELLSLADGACYLAKERGRDRIHVTQRGDIALRRQQGEMRWLQRIQRALEEQRFVLFAQRIMPLGRDGEGVPIKEVLVRMVDEQGRKILPQHFLPAAERYRLMPAIDRWVVGQVVRAIQRDAQNGDEGSVYSINLSGQTVCDDGFLEYVVGLVKESGIRPERLWFELTETAVISNLAFAKRFIETLRHMGCRFALDDFGSGLSSFAYLKTLPMDFIKIDGHFVQSLFAGKVDRALVGTIHEMGKVMGMRTIAEFVESERLLDALRRIGVDYAQGNFIEEARPMYSVAMNATEQSSPEES